MPTTLPTDQWSSSSLEALDGLEGVQGQRRKRRVGRKRSRLIFDVDFRFVVVLSPIGDTVI